MKQMNHVKKVVAGFLCASMVLFAGCSSTTAAEPKGGAGEPLEKVTVGANFSVNGDGTNTTAANKAILPTPSATYIPGADGNWYTFNGDRYAPNAMKDRTAATYYASFDMVADADVIVKNGSLIDTAKAIREKNGTTTQYTPSEFGAAIRAL